MLTRSREPAPEPAAWAGAGQEWTGSTTLLIRLKPKRGPSPAPLHIVISILFSSKFLKKDIPLFWGKFANVANRRRPPPPRVESNKNFLLL